jgi:hypothetical protein
MKWRKKIQPRTEGQLGESKFLFTSRRNGCFQNVVAFHRVTSEKFHINISDKSQVTLQSKLYIMKSHNR